MKKVIYPGPAIPAHMAESAYYPIHGITLAKGENILEDAVADYHVAAGNVRLLDTPVTVSEAASVQRRRPGGVSESEN